MIKTLPISEVRQNLPKIVDDAHKKLDQYIITVNGKPAARIISQDEYESLRETIEILADPKLMKDIKVGEEEIASGKGIPWEKAKKQIGLP